VTRIRTAAGSNDFDPWEGFRATGPGNTGAVEAISRATRRPGCLIPALVAGGVALLLVVVLVASYNGLVDKETAVDQSFADLDAQLQRRNDLIPNLVGAVRGILGQEQAVFGELARARSRYAGAQSDDERVAAANDISAGLGRLLAIVEAYPQLQSAQNVRDLQIQLEGTENRVAQARRDYNATTADYNRSIRRFPRAIVANLFGFDRRLLFRADPGATTPPTVDLGGPPSTTTPTSTPSTSSP
jgi:LemA protein